MPFDCVLSQANRIVNCTFYLGFLNGDIHTPGGTQSASGLKVNLSSPFVTDLLEPETTLGFILGVLSDRLSTPSVRTQQCQRGCDPSV